MSQTASILRPEDMTRLASYRFAVRMMAEGWLSGPHRARGRGSSTDFLEYRHYSPGDDPRMIDWRVFARTDRLQLKTFEHETHLECHLFVDSSASMGFREKGPISKLQYASHFAACLAWLVVRGHDRVSLHLFDETIRSFLPPGNTTSHLNECLHLLEHHSPGGTTNLPATLQRSHSLLKRPGTLVLISDFMCDTQSLMNSLNIYLHKGFKVILVSVLDPAEMVLPDSGVARFVDVETGEKVTCNLQDYHTEYELLMKAHQHSLHTMASARGMLFLPTLTTQSFYPLFDQLAK